MKYDVIIRGGTVVREGGTGRLDVAVSGGRIVELSPEVAGDAAETVDAAGVHVFPGLIDPHVHFNEPGRTEWEGIATGSSALAAGGGTLFFDMPLNSSPPVLDGESFDLKLAAMKAKSLTDFALWGGLTPNNLEKLGELADRGVVGLKAFMCNSGIDDFAAADGDVLRHGIRLAKQHGLLVAVHAESEALTSTACRGTSAHDYVSSRPEIAETTAISRAIDMAADAGCALHVVHVSTWMGIDLVREARSRGLDVTCETCPQYLELTADDVERIGAAAKCAPPLRSPTVRDELWRRVADGYVDFVASDHSPSPPKMKQDPNFFKVWGGIAGVQSTLSVLLSRRPALPRPRVAALTATNAAKRFRIDGKGAVEVGNDADLTLVDEHVCFELTRERLLDRHKLSPYVGRTFHGVVRRTLVRGRTVFQDGKIVAKPDGQLVKPRS